LPPPALCDINSLSLNNFKQNNENALLWAKTSIIKFIVFKHFVAYST